MFLGRFEMLCFGASSRSFGFSVLHRLVFGVFAGKRIATPRCSCHWSRSYLFVKSDTKSAPDFSLDVCECLILSLRFVREVKSRLLTNPLEELPAIS